MDNKPNKRRTKRLASDNLRGNMKIQIDGVDIIELSKEDMYAIDWRFEKPVEEIKLALQQFIMQIKKDMVANEFNRIGENAVGVPRTMKEKDVLTWLVLQPGYMNAKDREIDKLDKQRISNK